MAKKTDNPAPRTDLLQIRLTPEERELLETVARADDRPLSTWARRQLLRIARDEQASKGKR